MIPTKAWEPPTTAAAMPLPAPETQPQASAGSSQPYWDGPWLMNYWESKGDCAEAKNSYWVAQPGNNGMDALKVGCFPFSWTHELNNKCHGYGDALPAGVCAVWDPDQIMSRYNRHGNLLIVKLPAN